MEQNDPYYPFVHESSFGGITKSISRLNILNVYCCNPKYSKLGC